MKDDQEEVAHYDISRDPDMIRKSELEEGTHYEQWVLNSSNMARWMLLAFLISNITTSPPFNY